MSSIRSIEGKFIAHVQRLPVGAVALKDHLGKTFMMIGPDGHIGGADGEAFFYDRATAASPEKLGSGRYELQDYNSCDVSPLGICIGDTETDEDYCIFCGQPEERK